MTRRSKEKVVFDMVVVPGGLRPATTIDEQLLSAYRHGSTIEVTLHQGKSNAQLKFLWGFLSFVIDATGCYPDKKPMMAALLTSAGYLESFTALMGGGTYTHPASVAEMEHDVFNRFCQSALDLIEDEYGITADDYRAFLRSKTGA